MFVSHHTLKWTRTCRSHGRHPHAHTAHFLLNRHRPCGAWRPAGRCAGGCASTMRFVCAGRGRRPRSPPPFGMTAPAARKGTPPASAPACAAAAASSSSTGRPGISTAGRPCRSARSSSSHARTRGISSLCWMAFSRHPAHHRGRIIFHATKMTGRHACVLASWRPLCERCFSAV